VNYLGLEDLLVIGEQVLDVPAVDLMKICNLGLADSALHSPAASFGGVEFYPELAIKAAVLCSHLDTPPVFGQQIPGSPAGIRR
jgi:hypothetical protein